MKLRLLVLLALLMPTIAAADPLAMPAIKKSGNSSTADASVLIDSAGTEKGTTDNPVYVSGISFSGTVTADGVAQNSTTSGQAGPLGQCAVTTAAPTYTTAKTDPLSCTTAGGLRVDGSGTTQPVSGTVTANAGTGTLAVSAVSLPLPSGASTATNQKPGIFWNGATGAASALAGSATFTGTARDVGVAAATAHNVTSFNASFYADQTGTASIEASNDNATWYTLASGALSASTPLMMTVPIVTRYFRAKLVNGGTDETVLWVNTSFTGG